MDIIYSLICILVGGIYIIYLLKRKNENSNLWDLSMNFKGLVAGILIIVLGIVLLFKNI